VEPQYIFESYVTGLSIDCIAVWLGCISYTDALDLQMRICELKKNGYRKDVLLLLEHPPTITLGRNGSLDHLLIREDELRSRGIELWHIDRGGDITFHGPGQLVGYPILHLTHGERDIRRYMKNLEESLIRLLSLYEIEGERDAKFTGVWLKNAKIAAMGVHISRWITRHGFALNVNTDLSFYDLIVPCGITGRSITSMQKQLSRTLGLQEIAEGYIREFAAVFNRKMVILSESEIMEELQRYTGNERFQSPVTNSICT
jgi:lipoate-protein ligase B